MAHRGDVVDQVLDDLHAHNEVECLSERATFDVEYLEPHIRSTLARELEGIGRQVGAAQRVAPGRGEERERFARSAPDIDDRPHVQFRHDLQKLFVHVPVNRPDPLDLSPGALPERVVRIRLAHAGHREILASMRVVLVSANFAPHVGGIERFTENLAIGLGTRGHAVEVVCCRFGAAPLHEIRNSFSVTRVPSSYVLDRRLGVPWPVPSPRLVSTLRRRCAAPTSCTSRTSCTRPPRRRSCSPGGRDVASVLTQHVGFVPQRHALLDTVERAALATLGRSARLATRVACLNPAVAEWVTAQWGVDDVRLLPVGVPARAAPVADAGEVRRSFGLAPDRFVALFVGRDVPKKGLDIFLAAANPAYDLVAVTDRSGPVPGVTLLPFMAHERLQELLGCVDAFVLPSEAEGFPVTIQEALLAGLPIVTPMLPGFERHLGAGDAIFIERTPESLRAALRRLLDDPELRRSLGRRGQAVAERSFGIDAFVDAYEELYLEAMSGRLASTI